MISTKSEEMAISASIACINFWFFIVFLLDVKIEVIERYNNNGCNGKTTCYPITHTFTPLLPPL